VGLTDRLDSLQQRYPALGFQLAVVYKYGDDQCKHGPGFAMSSGYLGAMRGGSGAAAPAR
jgi:hypothetical protein